MLVHTAVLGSAVGAGLFSADASAAGAVNLRSTAGEAAAEDRPAAQPRGREPRVGATGDAPRSAIDHIDRQRCQPRQRDLWPRASMWTYGVLYRPLVYTPRPPTRSGCNRSTASTAATTR